MRLALFGDGCSAAVLTAEDVKPGDNKWVIEGNQYFSNQTSITIKEARFLEILVFKNNELVNYVRFILGCAAAEAYCYDRGFFLFSPEF